MRLIEQKDKLNIENVGVQIIKKASRHSSLLPDSICGIFVGPSGYGESNVIFNLVIHRSGLRFKNIYLYSKTPNQEKYKLLKKTL
jgi:hypothetical protein